jgi:DNA-binding MarR family transcriptional regulator
MTNHAHVLFCLAEQPELRLREVAERVGITERAVHRVVGELEEAGYLERERVGRRNVYTVFPERPLRHPIEAHRTVGDLFRLVLRR